MGRPRTAVGTWGAISVTKLRSGRFQARAWYREFDGSRHRHTKVGSTANEAKRRLTQKLTARSMAAGYLGPSTNVRFSEVLTTWLESKKAMNNVTDATIESYERHVERYARPALGSFLLLEMTTGRLEGFLQSTAGKSPHRARVLRSVVGQALDVAVRNDLLFTNPVRATSRVRPPREFPTALTKAELDELRDKLVEYTTIGSASGPPASAWQLDAFDLLTGTGLRIGEAFALQWKDIDLAASPPRAIIRSTLVSKRGSGLTRIERVKTRNSARNIPLARFVGEMLDRCRARAISTEPDDFVIANRNGGPASTHNFRRTLRLVGSRTDIDKTKKITPHLLRRTAATHLAENYGVAAAAALLGHSTELVTLTSYVARNNLVPPEIATWLEELAPTPSADTPPEHTGEP